MRYATSVFMLNIIKTATKESIFYKLPTLIGDILIQVGVLLFLLHGTDMVRENNLPLYEQSGSWFLLAVSAILPPGSSVSSSMSGDAAP